MTRLFAGTPFDIPPTCERCGQAEEVCQCPPAPPPPKTYSPPGDQKAKIVLERRAKGKMVTIVRGLSSADNDLHGLLKQLKNICGTGGTVRQDELELQGDQVTRVTDALLQIGYRLR